MPAVIQPRDDDLDAFDFDERLPVIADVAVEDEPRADADGSFMLGDYSEKGHFPASSSILRNEVLEGVSVSATEADGAATEAATGLRTNVVAFQCLYCKHVRAEERASCSVIIPRDLMSILDCFVEFQRTHLKQCTHIPRDIRECYMDFKAQDERHPSPAAIADDPFIWTYSAVRRGLRDKTGGGIEHCPDLSASAFLEGEPEIRAPTRSPDVASEEPDDYFEHETVLFGEYLDSGVCDELMTTSKAKPIPADKTF